MALYSNTFIQRVSTSCPKSIPTIWKVLAQSLSNNNLWLFYLGKKNSKDWINDKFLRRLFSKKSTQKCETNPKGDHNHK